MSQSTRDKWEDDWGAICAALGVSAPERQPYERTLVVEAHSGYEDLPLPEGTEYLWQEVEPGQWRITLRFPPGITVPDWVHEWAANPELVQQAMAELREEDSSSL